MAEKSNFAVLRGAQRVWAVGSIHGEFEQVATLHDVLSRRLQPGDRLVYLGNILGHGADVHRAVDSVLAFRRAFLARPGVFVHDVALLRGAQEEMWQKLFQLQFAVNPSEVLEWMVAQGLGATIEAYGGRVGEGIRAMRQGPMAITRWTGELRDTFQSVSGHQDYLSALRHAAFTRDELLLFVSRSIDPERPLDAQNDVFWWGNNALNDLREPYGRFRRIICGMDPERRGAEVRRFTLSLDGGAGFGGRLLAGCINADGEVADVIEA